MTSSWWKAILGGFLAAVGAGIAYLIWAKIKLRQTPSSVGNQGSVENQPGDVGDSNPATLVTKSFGSGAPGFATPPIPGPFGMVQSPTITAGADNAYSPVPNDNRVPEFLIGSSGGGVADPAMPGQTPPAPLGPPPIGGSGNINSPAYNKSTSRTFLQRLKN